MPAFFRTNRYCSTILAVLLLGVLLAGEARGQYSNWQEEDTTDLDGVIGPAAVVGGAVAVTSPFWVPLSLTRKQNSKPGYFAEYPYKHGMKGNMLIGDTPKGDIYDWVVQAETSYAEDFSGTSRIGAALQLDGVYRFGVDADVDYWRTSSGMGQYQDFWTGDANLLYRFAQSEWLQTRVGLGGNWLDDDTNTDVGINFTYKVDVFLSDPFILCGELDWGTLGGEELIHPQITLGAQWHRAEVFIGCDVFDIGPTQTTGLLIGARLWY